MKTIRIHLAVFGLFLITLLFISCNKEEGSNPVAPTNKFLGKWKSETPILVKIKTDFCTGTLEDVATILWDVYWVVEETQDPNVMNITMNYSSSNFTVINNGCNTGTGYVPEPPPMYLTGYISNNTLSVEYLGEEIFQVDYVEGKVLRGELSYSYCMVYCQEIYTDENSFSIKYY